MKIRECTAEDLEIIRSISEITFVETFGADNREEDMKAYLQENFSVEKLYEELSDSRSRYLLVFVSDQPAAYMKINFGEAQTEKGHEHSLEVQRIYVEKKYKGQKIGQKLIEKAVETAKAENLKYIWLGVWEHNTAAIRFYEKMGFVRFDRHVFMLGDDIQTDDLMKLEL